MRIVILGPDGAGKSSVIRGLVEKLNLRGCAVEVRHLKPRIVFAGRGEPVTIVVDPHGKPPRSAFLSLVKIVVWLFEEWYAQIFLERKERVLLCDRYYHDLLIDPKRYRYGGPHWAARLIGGLMPRPKLWILLDAPPAVLRARKQEVSPQETARQREAYLAFIRRQRNSATVEASRLLENVIADVERAITAIR